MEYLIAPDSYSSLIGTVSLLIAAFCLFITFCEKQRSHATKLFSIMLVASISFFSAHWSTYFAAIFIVATAVTELEFLQNLAAIIRKDENYFNFKKEALSREENIRRKAEEAAEEEYATEASVDNFNSKDSVSIDLSKLQDIGRGAAMRLAFDVEEKALDFVAKKYGKIERGVRFRKDGESIEFDGLISSKDNRNNKVFEVKWTRNPEHFFPFISLSIRKASEISQRHESITGHKAEVYLVVVTNTETSVNTDKKVRLENKAKEEGINIVYLSLSEIGFDVTHETA